MCNVNSNLYSKFCEKHRFARMTITPRDQKLIAWVAVIIGIILTVGGLFGIWFQGLVYEKGFPTPATIGEIRLAFTLPTVVTTTGSLLVAAVILASPLTAYWTTKRRFMAFICFAVFVLVLCSICGYLAGSRVAKILN
jgi:hypothetical protein